MDEKVLKYFQPTAREDEERGVGKRSLSIAVVLWLVMPLFGVVSAKAGAGMADWKIFLALLLLLLICLVGSLLGVVHGIEGARFAGKDRRLAIAGLILNSILAGVIVGGAGLAAVMVFI